MALREDGAKQPRVAQAGVRAYHAQPPAHCAPRIRHEWKAERIAKLIAHQQPCELRVTHEVTMHPRLARTLQHFFRS